MLVFVPHLLIPSCDQNSTQLPIHALTRYLTSAISTLFIQYLLLLQHFVGFYLPRVWFHALGSACHGFGFMPLGSRKFWFSSKFFSLNLLCPSLKSCNTTVNVSIYLSICSILSCIALSLTSFFNLAQHDSLIHHRPSSSSVIASNIHVCWAFFEY